MDTKWRNRKNAISFMAFVLGASLALGGVTGILKDKPGRVRIWQVDELLQDDYQQDYRFQEYITGRFWDFLTMAVGGNLAESWGYGGSGYWNGGYEAAIVEDVVVSGTWNDNWERYQDDWDMMQDTYQDMMEEWDMMQDTYQDMMEEWELLLQEKAYAEAEAYREEIEEYQEELESYQEEMENLQNEMEAYQDDWYKEPTEEEKKKAALKYHDRIKGNKNLLYTISYEGEVLYANSELLIADGKMTAPDGYNFLLYFDGEKVRIIKDGKELNIYGDGYYREGNSWQEERESADWYVPGYQNFPVDESLRKAKVFLAAAKEPVLYMEGSYGAGGSIRYDNSIYWMYDNCQANRKLLKKEAVYAVVGLALLFLAFCLRKERKKAEARIAGIQARIWVECKVILLLGLLALVFLIIKSSNQVYGWWQEFTMAYCYDYGYDYGFANLPMYVGELLRNAHPVSWVVLFWGIWLIRNDFKHNKKVWKHSLAGKLYRTFSLKSLNWPLARRMACRNLSVFIGTAFYVAFMVGMAFSWRSSYRGENMFILLAFLGTVAFLFLAYLAAKNNMVAARDMEAISGCIHEIRNGNYTDIAGDYTGHDLQNVMAELEDIRHGMEKAVEEQMKSQKMKVELIANVSHDIKTPLTSIISYVQFLKGEEGLPEHVKDYVRILDEKSQRLKNMVQDVFAVSKAASGELPMHMEKLDFGKLLRQTLADMEEQIKDSAVSFRTELPEAPVMIMADGQRLYRVFQNLFQNAIQYSLAGSRVYVTLQTDGTMAVASVKNASMMELDKDKDFAERFTRGDKSRTDGGSGLGLSIAQSFTEACGGKFSWETDADLFVVKVSFSIER